MSHDLSVLLDGLASPDPAVRDGWAYAELAEGTESGRFAEEWPRIRAAALAHLESADVQARTFAPLMLTWLVAAGDRDRGAFDAVARWYPAESDTRGFDDELGWLHAVAHGADYLGECARAGIATGPQVLDLLAARLLGPGTAWRDQEDARVDHAAVIALGRCSEADATAWLDPVITALDTFETAADGEQETGRPPSWLHNLYATCASLYVALSEQPRDGEEDARVDHADATCAALVRILSRMTPWLLRSRERANRARERRVERIVSGRHRRPGDASAVVRSSHSSGFGQSFTHGMALAVRVAPKTRVPRRIPAIAMIAITR